jgi:hypothetical protein
VTGGKVVLACLKGNPWGAAHLLQVRVCGSGAVFSAARVCLGLGAGSKSDILGLQVTYHSSSLGPKR